MKKIKNLKEIDVEDMLDPVILVVRERRPNIVKALIYEYSKGPDMAAVLKRDSFYKIKKEIQDNTNLIFIPRTAFDSKLFFGCWIKSNKREGDQ